MYVACSCVNEVIFVLADAIAVVKFDIVVLVGACLCAAIALSMSFTGSPELAVPAAAFDELEDFIIAKTVVAKGNAAAAIDKAIANFEPLVEVLLSPASLSTLSVVA